MTNDQKDSACGLVATVVTLWLVFYLLHVMWPLDRWWSWPTLITVSFSVFALVGSTASALFGWTGDK